MNRVTISNRTLNFVVFLLKGYGKYSPFINQPGIEDDVNIHFQGYDQTTDQCSFLLTRVVPIKFDGANTLKEDLLHTTDMVKISFDYKNRYIKFVNVFFSKGFLEIFFEHFLDSDNTRAYICSVIEGPCRDYNLIDNSSSLSCESQLASLNATTFSFRADGRSQACRALHSVFASTNSKHCPHISFLPMEDNNGKVKCQPGGTLMQPEDLFTKNDFEIYAQWAIEKGFDPKVGHDYVKMENQTITI